MMDASAGTLELKNDSSGTLSEIRIGGICFNGYAGKTIVPEYMNVSEIRRKEKDCVSRKFRLSLKEEAKERSGFLKILIPYPYPPYRLKVWSAHQRFPDDLQNLGGLRLYYGDVTYGTLIPAVVLFDPWRNIGLTVVKAFGRTGGRLSFNFGTYHESGMEVEFSELALIPGKTVELELLMHGHAGCWRPGLKWIRDRYPAFFEPVNPEVWTSHGAFAITNPFTKPEALDKLPIRWSEIHNHFPYYGNYAPEEPEWESVVLHDYPELTSEIPCRISPALINTHIETLHQRNIKAMLYIQINGDCLMEKAETLFPDSIARDAAGKPIPSWRECCFLNASEGTSFGSCIHRMIDRFIAMYPKLDGVFLDQLCYQTLDYAHSDGRTAVDGKEAAEYGVSYEYNLKKLASVIHEAGKVIWANGPFDIEAAHLTDGIMSEGTSGISESHKYLCLRKPFLIHTYPTDPFKTESMLRYCLLAGAAWSYGGSSTLRIPPEPSPEIRLLFEAYLPMIEPLTRAEILLEANPFTLPFGYRGEIFQSAETGEIMLTALGVSSAGDIPLKINLPHENTAFCRGNRDRKWEKISFEGDILNVPNTSTAYIIRFLRRGHLAPETGQEDLG